MAASPTAGPAMRQPATPDRHRVEFRFADGVTRSLDMSSGANILDAGLEEGLPLLHQCRSGSCSSCIATLVAGDAVRQAGTSSTLLRSEYEAGHRLLCQTAPAGDCVFDLSYESSVGAAAARTVNAFVNSVERVASNVVKLTLELADGDWLTFRPGQFVQIAVPGTDAVRSYSPASAPETLPVLEFYIRLLPGGKMSNWLTETAAPDQVIQLTGPFGAFYLREKIRAPHILIAGGTGLAPILSIVDALRGQSGRKPPMLLSFGCLNPEALFGLSEIGLRRQWLPTLEARISVDQQASGDLLLGNPVAALRAEDCADPDSVAYLCGPPPMIEAARQRLEEFGLRPENIFAEQFVASN